MNWRHCILIGLVFFALGFLIGWQPAFESVRDWVLGALSIGLILALAALGVEVVGLLSQMREKKEKNKLSHAKRDIEPELKILAESKISFNEDLKL